MRVLVITPPADAVSLEDAKLHLKLDHDDEDLFLSGAIAAAVGHLDGPDGWLGRALGVQTLEARFSDFCEGRGGFRLPYPPLIEVLSVKHLDGAGVEQAVPAASYEAIGSRVAPAHGFGWPSYRAHPEAVRVRYRAGYEVLPKPIRAAILLMVGDLYRFRETVVVGTIASSIPMSTTVESLLAPYRVFR